MVAVLALRNEKDGQLEVSSTVNGQGVKRVVYSRVLVDCLRPLQSGSRGHISAWYDAAMGALLLGDDGMETEFDHQAFRRLDLSRIHRFPCQIAPGYLRIRQTFQNRSEALYKAVTWPSSNGTRVRWFWKQRVRRASSGSRR